MIMQIQKFFCMSKFLHFNSKVPEIQALSALYYYAVEVVKCNKKETRIRVSLVLYL